MTATEITVQGSFSAWYPAERATVWVTVSHDGPSREPVFEATSRVAGEVTRAIEPLVHPETGPVTRWSSERVRVWSDRPWNNQGTQLAPVFHATIGISVRFRDFDALARFVESLAVTDGVDVGTIAWELTGQTRVAAETDARTRAVHAAIDKARVFAAAAGLGEVTPVAIADVGMLGSREPEPRMIMSAMSMKGSTDSDSALDFTPDRIEVSASVDARFSAQ